MNELRGRFFHNLLLPRGCAQMKGGKWVASRTSRTPAHESAATVAPFRAWRGLQRIIARGPIRLTIELWLMTPGKPGQQERALCGMLLSVTTASVSG